MGVRAKFVITQKQTTVSYMGPDQPKAEVVTVYGTPVCPPWKDGKPDPDHPNASWWKATPTGRFELGTVNPAAADQLVIGREYYVDFTPAED